MLLYRTVRDWIPGDKGSSSPYSDFQKGDKNGHPKYNILIGQKCIGTKLQLFTSQLRHGKGP